MRQLGQTSTLASSAKEVNNLLVIDLCSLAYRVGGAKAYSWMRTSKKTWFNPSYENIKVGNIVKIVSGETGKILSFEDDEHIDILTESGSKVFAIDQIESKQERYPSGHVFGAFQKINALICDLYKDKSCRVCLVLVYEEFKEPKIRLFKDYKSGRIKPAFSPIPDVLELLSYLPHEEACIPSKDAEADDIIATYVAKHPNHRINILTMDKDLWQLIGPNVRVLRKPDDFVSSSELDADFGVPPGQEHKIALIKAIDGDTSDKIPGVGELDWDYVLPLIWQCDGTPENFFDIANKSWNSVPPRTKEKLVKFQDRISLMFRLTKLSKDLTISTQSYLGEKDKFLSMLELFDCKSIMEKARQLFV